MSKTSKRHPGTGYANGYDCIDWGKNESPQENTLMKKSDWAHLLKEVVAEVKICQHCKHWLKEYGFSHHDGAYTNGCGSDAVHAHLSERAEFWPPANFGCNRWEVKL